MSEAGVVVELVGVAMTPPPADAAEPVAEAPSFEAFVATRGNDLWRSAYLLTGDAHRAEDLLQTALVKVWRRWPSVAKDGAVEGYVRRALITTYTDWWRRRWTGEIPVAVVPEAPLDARPDDDLVLRHDVLTALATLTRGQRAVIVLRYFDDLTETEAAAALGGSVGTVKSQSSRAIRALRSAPSLAGLWPESTGSASDVVLGAETPDADEVGGPA